MQINLTDENIARAREHIQRGIDAGREGTDVEVTALGVLFHVIEALGKPVNFPDPWALPPAHDEPSF